MSTISLCLTRPPSRFIGLLQSTTGKCWARNFSTDSDQTKWKSVHLSNRSVVSVEGEESATFLQGLMTNNIHALDSKEKSSIYCTFLNTGGRILFDTIISPGFQPNQYLIECDDSLSKAVIKHLNMYKVRRKLKISKLDNMAVHSLFHDNLQVTSETRFETRSPLPGSTFCDGGTHESKLTDQLSLSMEDNPNFRWFPDPRVDLLGYRYIGPVNNTPSASVQIPLEEKPISDYDLQRCWSGVAEGPSEIPPTKCFPLEYNLDYLHGVNFHKGCYIGQELTARTHHTGVIRKRILPIAFKTIPTDKLDLDTSILNEKGKSVGKLRRTEGPFGLALIRLQEAFAAENLTCGGLPLDVWKPMWWPPEKDAAKKDSN